MNIKNNNILTALLECGFDAVYEVSKAAEIITEHTRRYMKKDGLPRPIISSACPAIVRLISLRFPCLVDNLLPIMPPIEYAARQARREALAAHPLVNGAPVIPFSSLKGEGKEELWRTILRYTKL